MTRRRGPGERRVSGPESKLWRAVTRGVRPLAGRDRRPREATPEPAPEPETETEAAGPPAARAEKPGKGAPRPPRPARPLARGAAGEAPRRPQPPLAHGAAPGLDKRTAERLRRGLIPVEAEADLHGHTLEGARRALAAFLERAGARKLRCVLVITGRGLRTGAGEGVMPRGVLRDEVPRWLNEPANRARVLAFCHAQPKDGGVGALYVLLKKTR